jgi:hypothetical protein
MKVAARRKPSAKASNGRPRLAPPAPADEPVSPLPPPLPPGPDARMRVTEEYARHVARDALFWAWPMIDIYNRRMACAQVPDIVRAGALAVAPLNRLAMLADFLPFEQRTVACPDQDAVHGFGVLALDLSPVVIQVPEFGQRHWAYHLVDLRSDRFAKLGRVHATRPGFYLVAGPQWEGDVPRGITQVLRAPTATGLFAPRIFQDDTPEDNYAAQRTLGEVAMYPLAEFDGRTKRREWAKLREAPAEFVDAANAPRFAPERFVELLAAALADAPARRGEEALHAQVLAVVGAARADARLAQAMAEGARDAHERLVKPLAQFRGHGLPLPHHWSTIANGAGFGTDYFARTASARRSLAGGASDETKHFHQDLDAGGERLNSAHRYTITLPRGGTPPVHAFWSLSIYDEQHFFVANSIDRFSIGARTRDLRIAADGSLTIFVQSSMPTDPGQRPNWLPAPVGDFSLHMRAYWPKQEALDGTWTPPPVVRLSG